MRRILFAHLVDYPTPVNLNYSWNWGALAGLAYVWQVVSGIFLAMHFGVEGVVGLQAGPVARSVVGVDTVVMSPGTDQRVLATVMRDVPNGRWLRIAHANGASLFFMVVYVHMIRAFYYSSWSAPNEAVWLLGIVLLLLMIITAFIGYVLPWGQMSFWGATVITSLASAVPLIGWSLPSKWKVVYWLWGGFAVDTPSVARFYSLHYTLPFIIAGVTLLHLVALHTYGSTNPLGLHSSAFSLRFYPYFAQEDFVGMLGFLLVALVLVAFYPDWLGHPDNFIPANPYVTPAHIVPEWYFLWVYAILRSIPNKTAGVALIAGLFVTLAALPFLHVESRSPSWQFRRLHAFWFWTFVADLGILVWLGAGVIEPATLFLGQVATCHLIGGLVLFVPWLADLEHECLKT